MGSFRSKPAVEKDVESGVDQHGRAYVCGSMQGWRIDQEDAHLIVTKEKQYAIYGVFDGHGGPEVSALVAKHLLRFLQRHPKWDSDKEAAVCGAFKELDQFIMSAAGQREMRDFLHLTPDSVAPMEEKEVDMLQQEAAMPVEDLVEAELRRHRDDARDTMETPSTGTTSDTSDASAGASEPTTMETTGPSLLSEDSNSAMDMTDFQTLQGGGERDGGGATGTDGSSVRTTRGDTADTRADQRDGDDVGGDTEDDDEDGDEEYVPGQKDKQGHEGTGDGDGDGDEEGGDGGEAGNDSKTAANALFATTESGFSSGTTANVVIMDKSNVLVANAGDCRTVVCRAGEAVELSIDHKPSDEPERSRILKAGSQVTANGRIDGGLNLSRALGDWRYKQCSSASHEEQAVSYVPDFQSLELKPEDEFLVVACDGIWNTMESQEVVDFVRQRLAGAIRLKEVMTQLLDTCMAPTLYSETGAGCDNETAIIIVLKDIAGEAVAPIAPPRSFFGEDTAPRFLQSSIHRPASARAEEDAGADEGQSDGAASPASMLSKQNNNKKQRNKKKRRAIQGTAGAEDGGRAEQPATGAASNSVASEEDRKKKRKKKRRKQGESSTVPAPSSSPFMVLDPILQDPVSESGDDTDAGDADSGEDRHCHSGSAAGADAGDGSPRRKREKRGTPDGRGYEPVVGQLGLAAGRASEKVPSTEQERKQKDKKGEAVDGGTGAAEASEALPVGHMDDISGGASALEEPMVVDTKQAPTDGVNGGSVSSAATVSDDTESTDGDGAQALDPRYTIDANFPHADYLQDVQDIVKLSDTSYTETTSL